MERILGSGKHGKFCNVTPSLVDATMDEGALSKVKEPEDRKVYK